MFKAVIHIDRLREDRLGEIILDVINDQSEDAFENSPLEEFEIDPIEDIDTVAIVVDTVDAQEAGLGDMYLELGAPMDELGAPAGESAGGLMPADDFGLDDGEPPRALRSIAAIRGNVDHDAVMAWIEAEDPPERSEEGADVRWMGTDAFCVVSVDDVLAVTSGKVFVEDAITALRSPGAPDALPLGRLLEGEEGTAHTVMSAQLDALEDAMARFGDLPGNIPQIKDVGFDVQLRDGALRVEGRAQMTPGSARVAATALEGARAAWAMAGFNKRFPGFRPLTSELKFVAEDGEIRITLALTQDQSRSVVNEVIDLVESDDMDDEDYQ